MLIIFSGGLFNETYNATGKCGAHYEGGMCANCEYGYARFGRKSFIKDNNNML